MSHDPGAVCRCCAEHRPPVLEYAQHHILPKSLGGPDVPENRVWICDNAHRNVHELLRLLLKTGRTMTDWELQQVENRPVSRYAATLAREGYTRWEATL